MRYRGGGGDELVKASRWTRDAVLTLRAPSGFSMSPSGVYQAVCVLGEALGRAFEDSDLRFPQRQGVRPLGKGGGRRVKGELMLKW